MHQRIPASFLLAVLLLGGLLAPVVHRYQHEQQLWTVADRVEVVDLRGQGQPVSRATTVVPDTEDCLLCAFVLTGVPSHYSAALVGYLYAAAFDHLTTRVSGPAIYFTSIRAPPSV